MKTHLFLFAALGLMVMAAGCSNLNIAQVSTPSYQCLFSPSCNPAITDTAVDFSTNVPPTILPNTNSVLSGVLHCRTFAGQPGSHEAGQYGYEYQLVLSKLTGTSGISLNSMTIPFGAFESFSYNGQTNYQAWEVTSGGPGNVGLSSVTASNSFVTFNFSPPLTISSTGTNLSTSTYRFGLISSAPPPNGVNAWATFIGTDFLPDGSTASMNWLMLLVEVP